MIRSINRVNGRVNDRMAAILKKEQEEAAPTEKDCPYCYSKINIKATRCPHCTAEIK